MTNYNFTQYQTLRNDEVRDDIKYDEEGNVLFEIDGELRSYSKQEIEDIINHTLNLTREEYQHFVNSGDNAEIMERIAEYTGQRYNGVTRGRDRATIETTKHTLAFNKGLWGDVKKRAKLQNLSLREYFHFLIIEDMKRYPDAVLSEINSRDFPN